MIQNPKVVVVTGAAHGIGFAFAKICLQKGMSIVIADVNAVDLELAYQNLLPLLSQKQRLKIVHCDVSSAEAMHELAKQTFASFKQIDWLFNNAGISGTFAPFWEIPINEINQVINVNLYGVINGIQAFIPYLFAQNHRSRIINMASLYGLCSGSQLAPYIMSKHAIVALSESLFFDLQRLHKNVDVSVVCPSFVDTSLLNKAAATSAKQDVLNKMLARGKNPIDIAKHIVDEIERDIFYILPDKEVKFYNSERASAITDQKNPSMHSVEHVLQTLFARAAVIAS